MKKIAQLLLISLISLLLTQISNQERVTHEKPRINMYGTIIDASGKKFQAENITIGGAYQHITVYVPPASATITPSHKVKIDLTEDQIITIPHTNEGKAIVQTFNKRHYIEIMIASKSSTEQKTENKYIIEQAKRIQFDEPQSEGTKEHEMLLSDAQQIIIAGKRMRVDHKQQPA